MYRTLRSSRWHAVIAAVLAVVLLISAVPFVLPAKAENVGGADAFNTAVGDGKDITLTADITLDAGTATAYSGEIDGNGHVINLKGSNALFTEFSGKVSNLGVVAESTVYDNGIFAREFSGTMTACFAYGTIGYVDGGVVGGMVGTMSGSESKITESFSCVSMYNINASYAGGFIGTINGGEVRSCYSSGYLKVDDNANAKVAGFANLISGVADDTYTSCQLVNRSSKSLPSGVNGFYDNQLSVVRENASNAGLSTRDLMSNAGLSAKYVLSSTAYPYLLTFDKEHWGSKACDIARVSVAAAAFSDVDATKRIEPSWGYARADYLTLDSYIDKTNEDSFAWSIDKTTCKIYDTVPLTANTNGTIQSELSADLLRSRFVFTAATAGAKLTVKNGPFEKAWFLSAYDNNPYFAVEDAEVEKENLVYLIDDKNKLSDVRYYSRIGTANYKVTASIECDTWDAIDDFNGVFDGGNYTIKNVAIDDDGADNYGLFASSQTGSVIRNLALTGVTVATTDDAAVVGGLVGKATDTTISNVLVSVELSGKNAVGGLVGEMTGGSIDTCGVTGYVQGNSHLGGLIGKADGVTVSDCYSTAAVFAANSTSSDIGGLIGGMTGGSLSSSYAAALVDAAQGGAVVGAFGSDATISSSYYDKEMTPQNQAVNGISGLDSEELVKIDFSDDSSDDTSEDDSEENAEEKWIVSATADHYPQLAVFANYNDSDNNNNSDVKLNALSALSTQRVYFQKYWNDAQTANNMTTGWIAKEFISGKAFDEPTVIDGVCDVGAQVNEHTASGTAGFAFEASSGSRLLALRAEDPVSGGVRVIAAARNDMISLSYTVTGVDGVNTYVDLYYSSDSGNTWQGSQVMSPSGGTAKVLYDMPSGSIVKVRVRTEDDYEVASVKIGDTDLTKGDGEYYYSDSATALETDTTVNIVLEKATPEWGIRFETY